MFRPVITKVVVVGGGIFGVSSAVSLAWLGVDTTLVTDGLPANGASGRSLSWLNSARRRSDGYHRLRMIGIDRYRTLSAKYPEARWLRFDGGLTWDADDAANEIADSFAHEGSIGYDARLLSPGDIADVTPGVDARSVVLMVSRQQTVVISKRKSYCLQRGRKCREWPPALDKGSATTLR